MERTRVQKLEARLLCVKIEYAEARYELALRMGDIAEVNNWAQAISELKEEQGKEEMMSECEKHKGAGTVFLSDGTERCYGCYCEQFDYCPLCGCAWDDPRECKVGERLEKGGER